MVIKLSQSDHDRVSSAIATAEARTSGEISVVVARASDSYGDVVLLWSLIATLGAAIALALVPGATFDRYMALLHGWQAEGGNHRLVLAALMLALGAAFVATQFVVGLTPLRYALVPAAIRARRVRRRAIEHFRVGTEKRTVGRTGVLVLVSLAEHRAEIVADAAIHAKVSPESWGAAMAALVEAVKDGRPGDGLCDAIVQVGRLLALHFPPGGENPNEVPDRLVEI